MIADLGKSGSLADYCDGTLPENCFFCGEPLPSGAVVVWHGTRVIALHADCAGKLALHLAYDSLNAKGFAAGIWPYLGVDESLR